MKFTAVLVIAIIVLSILFIISATFNVLLWMKFKKLDKQLRWHNMSTRYSSRD